MYTPNHRDGLIRLSPNLNSSPGTARYGSHTTLFPQSSTPNPNSCTNANCHFENKTPTWGSPQLLSDSCSTCHPAPPEDGSHGKKHGDYYGTATDSCAKCHADHTQDGNPLAHAMDAGKRGLAVQFGGANVLGRYSGGTTQYPDYLPSLNPSRNGVCLNLYCHSDGLGRKARITPRWSGSGTTECYSCHGGSSQDNNTTDCIASGGNWDEGKQLCAPYLNMTSNGHSRLVGPQWIRKYPCHFCHYATVDLNGAIADRTKHVNGSKDVVIAPQWSIVGRPAATYDPVRKVCDNLYCHSDGTINPDTVKLLAWTERGTECNTCHGHPRGTCSSTNCHDGRTDSFGNIWTIKNGWPVGEDWKASTPMFPNQGAGTSRANSHTRHAQSDYTCDQCHASTIKSSNGSSSCIGLGCHEANKPLPSGGMSEVAHLNAAYHANKSIDVVFRDGGTYNTVSKTCSNTACHTGGIDPQWGASVNSTVICLSCHGTTGADLDSFSFRNFSAQAKINMTEWVTTGHGRLASSGVYPASGNPAANFPGNPCWYCHDNNVYHNNPSNPFRLRQYAQFNSRFNKECVYCHMTGTDSECMSCHNTAESLAPQLSTIPADPAAAWPDGTAAPRPDHTAMTDGLTSCITSQCHYLDPATPTNDLKLHNEGSGLWSAAQQADVRNQYLMMGVCLKCHDDDSGGKCASCHTAPPDNPFKYALGFDPGTGFVKPQKARASSVHFGYKHYRGYQKDGVWKGGKFCWDCHDPHGDKNIYMVQGQVATSTDGTFGIPRTRAEVSFTRKQSGLDYARTVAPYNGICNVCHSAGSQHYRSDGGDGHSSSRICTDCHEHRFSDSHADGQACTTCHLNKPVPRHSGFGLPRDCTKCHLGTVGKRMDVMGQFAGTSHHIQGVEVTSKHCYACHWESTPDGLIDNKYHEGYNYKTYTSVKNAKVDLVLYGPGTRPASFKLFTTAIQFTANSIGTANERQSAADVSLHCLSCHNDQNNNSQPFGDCRTPRQYAWDKQSVASRYSQAETTTWGKYATNGKRNVVKALSAHGNAAANNGGWSSTSGVDGAIPNTRNGTQGVQCFDCHSSHGSRIVGVTSSYITFNGTRNGGNLKETQAGKGGYSMTYKASTNTAAGAVNPYSAGAGQCFDCHLTQNAVTTPWGYQSTFGATAPIIGYMDSSRFGTLPSGMMIRYPYKTMNTTGGHLKASSFLNYTTSAQNRINGLCTPCHDPHGVSQSLGSKKAYAVPLLKGTWMSSPYPEDVANPDNYNGSYASTVYYDDNVFGSGGQISEDDSKFGGLCLRCHEKQRLTDGATHDWESKDRVHEAVKGWKSANANQQHKFTCSKCHAPHSSGMKRLMVTNCFDWKHRGRQASGGNWPAGSGSGLYEGSEGPGSGSGQMPDCHPAAWPDNSWNSVTPW